MPAPAQARSFADLAAAVYRALGHEPNIDYVDTPVEIRDQYQYFTEARMERLRAAGFTAAADLARGRRARLCAELISRRDPYR